MAHRRGHRLSRMAALGDQVSAWCQQLTETKCRARISLRAFLEGERESCHQLQDCPSLCQGCHCPGLGSLQEVEGAHMLEVLLSPFPGPPAPP